MFPDCSIYVIKSIFNQYCGNLFVINFIFVLSVFRASLLAVNHFLTLEEELFHNIQV
jgi:hypothetical protein